MSRRRIFEKFRTGYETMPSSTAGHCDIHHCKRTVRTVVKQTAISQILFSATPGWTAPAYLIACSKASIFLRYKCHRLAYRCLMMVYSPFIPLQFSV